VSPNGLGDYGWLDYYGILGGFGLRAPLVDLELRCRIFLNDFEFFEKSP
jgi:hypothetical protein